jgi:hypothetical protein
VALSATFLVLFATVPVLAWTAAASTGTVGFSMGDVDSRSCSGTTLSGLFSTITRG